MSTWSTTANHIGFSAQLMIGKSTNKPVKLVGFCCADQGTSWPHTLFFTILVSLLTQSLVFDMLQSGHISNCHIGDGCYSSVTYYISEES